jgi:hypothetical protein
MLLGGGLAYKGLKAYKRRGDRREEQGQDRLSRKERIALAGGQLYVGKKALDAGAERLLGVQRFTHGTSSENAKGILSSGLLGSHGGKVGGSTDQLGDTGKVTARKIKGKIHIFQDNPLSSRLARGHANLAEKGGLDSHIHGIFGPPGVGGGGKTLYGEMDYDTYRKGYKIDPDYNPSRHMISGAAVSRTGVNADIHPDMIAKKRGGLLRIIKSRTKDIPAYIKKYPGRFLGGAALAGAGTKLGLNAYRNIRRKDTSKRASPAL